MQELAHTRKSWRAMLSRVKGGYFVENRYVQVCDRWNPEAGGSFENFLEDMGNRPQGTSLDRMSNDGDYVGGNCRWATPQVQGRNTAKRKNLGWQSRWGVPQERRM